jgi:hypothetical protein
VVCSSLAREWRASGTLTPRAELAERPAVDSPAADAATRAAAGAAPGASATQRTGGRARTALALLLTRRPAPAPAPRKGRWRVAGHGAQSLRCAAQPRGLQGQRPLRRPHAEILTSDVRVLGALSCFSGGPHTRNACASSLTNSRAMYVCKSHAPKKKPETLTQH